MAGKQREEGFGLVEQLQNAIRNSGRSLNQLAQLTGVDSGRLSRFMTGKRGLTQEALDRIFRVLHLRVVGDLPPPDVREGPPPADEPAPTKKPKRKGARGS